jgi:putative transposase
LATLTAAFYGLVKEIRTDRHRVFILYAQLVFLTKYRHKVLGPAHLKRTEEIMRDVCADLRAELAECNGEPGHVHLLQQDRPS